MKLYLFFIRQYFQLLSSILPRLAAHQALMLFQKPMNHIMRPLEKAFFASAKRFQIEHQPEGIDCYELGNREGQLVVLVHGWESNAGSMSAIATSLAEQGHRVVLFNLPAHGHSRLKYANLMTCSQALERVLLYYQYSGTPSLISHSFGSAVATFTLARTGIKVKKFMMLSTPDRILDIFNDFRNLISLGDEAFHKMLGRIEGILGEDLENVAINSLTGRINYEELNIIHDEFDKIIPYANSMNVYQNSPKATLTTLEKVGHYRMLWNNSVIKLIANHLNPRSTAG